MASLGRQDSVGSASSGATGMSAASSMAAAADMGAAGDIADQNQALQLAVFGPLITLYKQRLEDSRRFLVGRVLLEHLQLLLILLQPHWMWSLDYTHWLWELLNYVLLKPLLLPGGPGTYAAGLYLLLGGICLTIAGCGWVSYAYAKNGVVPNKWPVKLLRLCVMLLHKVFYVTVLNYLLGPLACGWLGLAPHQNLDFPAQTCTAAPQVAQLLVAAVAVVLHVAMGGLLGLAEVTPNPASRNWLAAAHSEVEVKAWALRSVLVLAVNLLAGQRQLQATPVLIAAGWLAYVHVRYQPYLFEWVNHGRTGLYAMSAYVALLATVNAWDEAAAQASGLAGDALAAARGERSAALTRLMLALLPVVALAGAALSWLRLHLWVAPVIAKFRALDFSAESVSSGLRDVHKFVDAHEVELCARVCRRWVDYEDGILEPDTTALAEHIIKAGLARFPRCAHMVVVYINHLASVADNQTSANSQLQAARKLEAGWCDRYVLYVREQQQAALLQVASGAASEGAVDLVGYVEFTRTYKAVLRTHKAALYAIRAFWKALLHSTVTFAGVTGGFARIEACRARADRAYRSALERYPANIKVLRAYARFLEDVKNDPWAAANYYTEADRLEELESGDTGGGAEAGALTAGGGGGGDDKSCAVCVINAQGIIQMANKPMLKMFGYRKGEVEGKNVSLLMPQPFAGRHNGFLRNYMTTGKAKILGGVREVVALHKERYVFPLTIDVSKVSGSGHDAIFMGRLRYLPDVAGTVKAWIMPAGGVMLCVDTRFADWFGLMPGECLGKPFAALAADADAINALLERAAAASPEALAAGRVCATNVLLRHKYAEPLAVDVAIQMGGSDAERLYVALITKRTTSDEAGLLMATDRRGRILYITSALSALLGAPSPKSLLRTEFSRFMAQPFMQLHSRWMKDVPAKVPLGSCRSGAPVVLISQQRTPLPAKLDIAARDGGGEEAIYVVKVKPVTFPAALLDRRLSFAIDGHGNVLSAAPSPASLFGFPPASAVGRNLAALLDVAAGLPDTGGPQGLDMEHLVSALVHKAVEQKESSWRCGVHPPMTPEEMRAAKSHALQSNMLANATKAALLQLEVVEGGDDHGGVDSITVHLWRADMLTGVVELDKECTITKAGCCPLHQPGPLFGVPSSALLHTPLSRWASVPPSYEGLLLEARKKGAVGGGLKRRAGDVKIGPSLRGSGRHNDGDAVRVSVRAVVKEGTGGAGGRLVVKLTVDKPSKGNPNFARRLLGLPDVAVATTTSSAGALLLASMAGGGGGGGGGAAAAPDQGDDAASGRGPEDDAAARAARQRGGVKFDDDTGGGGGGGEEGEDDDGASDDARPPRGGKGERLAEWVRQASGVTGAADEGHLDGEESLATTGFGGMLPPPPDSEVQRAAGGGADGYGYAAPPDTTPGGGAGGGGDEAGSQASGADDASSAQSGSEAGGYQSDFKRGKRLHKLARMLSSKHAQKACMRFYNQTVLVIGLLLAVHLACFVASVVLIDAQKQYIEEVDTAGTAVIAMHRMAIDCRVLDGVHRGVSQPGVFTPDDLAHFEALFADAIEVFEVNHEATYLGRDNVMRRFFNRHKYKLQDYWESPMWAATELLQTSPPRIAETNMSLWALGNRVIASAREVLQNHEAMVSNGTHLSSDPFWYFVMENVPWSLYDGYKRTLYGLVERVLAKIDEVSRAMVVIMVLEGCGLFMAAALYVCMLIRQMVAARAALFSVFLVIPTGFLRALASKQVQLDEDGDSDEDSEAGDVGGDAGAPPPQDAGQPAAGGGGGDKKLNLSLGAKKGRPGGPGARSGRGGGGGGGLLSRLLAAANPRAWFGAGKAGGLDTGKRRLVRNARDVPFIAAPFFVWGFIVILIYAVSMSQLTNIHSPFQMLNMINFLVFRTTRGVLFALETAMAAPNTTAVAVRQAQTAVRLRDLVHDYTSFMYGFPALGLPDAARSDLSTDTAALFENRELADIFFRTTACMRKDPGSCFPEGHKYYDVTHNGLDTMATRFLQETQLLVSDDPGSISMNSSRLEYIWQIGRFDQFEGMSHADQVFRDGVEVAFDELRTGHTIVFVVSLLAALGLWLGLVRPALRRAAKESRQIAELLSCLPPEMDVEGLIGHAIAGNDDDNDDDAGTSGAVAKLLSGTGAGSGKARGSGAGGCGHAGGGDGASASDAGTE